MPASRLELVAALVDREVAAAEADDADLGARHVVHDRLGHVLARGLELARQPLHVVHVVVRPLAVLRLLVVARAAREVRRHRLARDAAIRDAVAVDVLVASPLADLLQHLGVEALAAIERAIRILEHVGDIQVFMPRSRSLITKTIDWKRSARSNASIDIV